MVRNTYSAPKLLAHLKHHGSKSKPSPSFAELAAQVYGPSTFEELWNSQLATKRIDDLDRLWMRLARHALTLGDDQADREIRRAFEHFKLDHRNPFDWKLLVTYFS